MSEDFPEVGDSMMDDGIFVDMSAEEAASQDREPLPVGKYHYKITDMSMEHVREGKNQGKPYFNFEFTVQDGKYERRRDWTNAMLFEGALYTIAQILKAIGHPLPVGQDGKPLGGQIKIPTKRSVYIGKDLWGRRAIDTKQKERFPEDPSRWVQLRGFSKYETGTSSDGASASAASKQPANVLP